MKMARSSPFLLVGVLALSACALDTTDEEEVASDAEEIAAGRCPGTTATRTATVKVMTINLRNRTP